MAGACDLDPDDEILLEMDVSLCSSAQMDFQLHVMQYPLRPAKRPYDIEQCEQVRYKPKARRFEMDIPVDTLSDQYSTEENREIKSVTLQSSEVMAHTAYMIGSIRGGVLHLCPVDGIYHMRPDTSHIDSPKEVTQEDTAVPQQEGLKQLNVRVQKKETEAQAKRRLSSYAHIVKQENDEQWQILTSHQTNDPISFQVYEAMTKGIPRVIDVDMEKSEYMEFVAPLTCSTAPGQADASSMRKDPIARDSSVQIKVEKEDGATQGKPLKSAMNVLAPFFQKWGIGSLRNVREWLMGMTDVPEAVDAACADDTVLHEALIASGDYQLVKGVYVQVRTGDPILDPIRQVLFEILMASSKEYCKKSDVQSTLLEKGLVVSEATLKKILGHWCFPKPGGLWQVKPASQGTRQGK